MPLVELRADGLVLDGDGNRGAFLFPGAFLCGAVGFYVQGAGAVFREDEDDSFGIDDVNGGLAGFRAGKVPGTHDGNVFRDGGNEHQAQGQGQDHGNHFFHTVFSFLSF